ncbi:MAG: sensor histidine kinase [archaeon]|nr:sensor histidine kinase [archaeon]
MTPLVLMINELTTNTFKYAFEKEDKTKEIYKSIREYEKNGVKICEFSYKDSGKGLPDDFSIDSSKSLGWTIIKSLVTQLEGEYKIFNDNGFNFILEFPIIK